MVDIVDMTPYIADIRAVELFYHLTEEELERLLSLAEAVQYQKGEKILAQSETGDYLFAVVRGSADVSFKDLNDDEVFISSIESGEMFGEAAIFTSEPRTASVVCSEDALAVRIHKRNLMTFIRDNPRAGNKILMLIILSLLKKLKNANQDLAFEKRSEIDFNYADSLIQDFIRDI
jgi:CRP-like cAMP-binding protein